MKTAKDFRASQAKEDSLRKAVKLAPIKKSGKERHHMMGELDDDHLEEMESYPKRESILDYFDDEQADD